MKYIVVGFLFLTSFSVHATDFCQDYKDGIRTYSNLLEVASIASEMDWDQDGLMNRDELANGSNPCFNDTERDSDHDGLIDLFEEKLGKGIFIKLDPIKRDTDANGIEDLVQVCALTGEDRERMTIAAELMGDIYPAMKSYFDLAALCGI